MSAAPSDDTDRPTATEPPPPTPVVTQRNDSVLKRSSAEVSIMMMLRIPPGSPPPPPTLSVSVSPPPPVSSSSLPCTLRSPPPPSGSLPSCIILDQVAPPRSTPQSNPSTTSNLSAAEASTTLKTTPAATATSAAPVSSSSASSSSSTSSLPCSSTATKTTMMMTMMSPPTSSARRSTVSVQNWFQAELDVLGIESVYSRYIISLLLQQDNYHCFADGDLASSPECTHVVGGGPSDGDACSHHHQHQHHHHRQCSTANNNTNNNNNTAGDQSRDTAATEENKNAAAGQASNNNNKVGSGGGGGVGGAGNGRRQRSAGRRDRQQPLSAEQRKKKEAVSCLLEICDDILAGDVEDLIEELMLRLKQVDNERSSTTTQQPVISSSPSANNNNNNNNNSNNNNTASSAGNSSRQDPAEQYYAAFPALSSDTRMTSTQTQSSHVSLISGADISNVWKKKQQQQQSQKSAITLSSQTDNSVNLECTPTRGRTNNPASSRRRRGCLSHHGNKENLHKTPFAPLRGKEDRGSRYGSHTNRLRGGRGRSSRSLVSDSRQKLSQSSSHQLSGRNVGARRHASGGSGGNAPISSDGDYCLSVENILKDILRTANKNSLKADKVGQEQDLSYPYNFAGHLWIPKVDSGLKDPQPWGQDEGSVFKKMSLNLSGKAFEEDSAWYDISFLDESHASGDKDIPSMSPPLLSVSGIGPKGDERSYVRLYKRHSYPPPSPRSVLTLEGLEESEIFKKFSCLGVPCGGDKEKDPKHKIMVSASMKKGLAPHGTDNMYAATENVVDSSMRSLLDCSPEEVLPSLTLSPSDDLERSLSLLTNYTQLTELAGCSPSIINKTVTSGGIFAPAPASDLSPCGWSASPIKALSPTGVASSPTTPLSSPGSTTSLSLLDVSYLTNMADREKGSLRPLEENPRVATKNTASGLCLEHLFPGEFSYQLADISSLFESPRKMFADIKTTNFTHDPYVFVSNAQNEDDDKGFDLAVTPTPAHGTIGQSLYNSTTYRPWSYALVEERIVSEVQSSDILARNERFSQVWDVNIQRRVIPSSQNCHSNTNFSYSQHSPKLEATPSFLLRSACYELSTPRVTPFTFFFSSVLSTSPPLLKNLSSSESTTRLSERSSGKTSKRDATLSKAACSKTLELPDEPCSASSSSSPNVKLALTMTTTVLSSSHSAISSASSGTSSSSSSPLLQEPSPGDEPARSHKLVPSANSAFVSVVPKKKNEDAIKQRIPLENKEGLKQTNPSASSPRETLYFSPQTHFQPIRSPLPLADTLELSLSENIPTGMNTVVKASDLIQPTEFVPPPCLYQPPDLFGGHTASRSPYQQFKPETSGEEDGNDESVSFVPSFKILKDHDKFVQTGGVEENLDVDLEKLADELCTEDAKPCAAMFPRTANLRATDPGRRSNTFASVWKQPNSLSDLSTWHQEDLGKDPKSAYLNAWNPDRTSGWTPVTSIDGWPSAFSSPSSSLCSLEHRPYVFARDSVWYTTAGTLSAVRDDAWLSSSSGTPNSELSTPCTASTAPQSRVNAVSKTKPKKGASPAEACISPSLLPDEESSGLNESIWSSSVVDWTVNSPTPVYLRVNPSMWDADEGCGETVVEEEEACKFTSPEIKPQLLTPETLKQASSSSSQSIWPDKIWEPGTYDDIHAEVTLPKGPKAATNSFVQKDTSIGDKETEISTEEDPAPPESQDGSCSLGYDSSNIWAVPNATMWALPILNHSSSSSTSASLAASPSSAPSPPPPMSAPAYPTSSDPLLDLVCGPTCVQTAGASKPCQHQQIRKIWEHMGPTAAAAPATSTVHGDSGEKKEIRKNSPHQAVYGGGKENRTPLMNSVQTSTQELPSFGSVRQLASVSVTPPGASNLSSNHQTPPSNTLSLGPPPLVPLPTAAVYSSELEKQWLSGETSCSSSAASVQRTKMQREKSRSCRKPCSFYLEGNCWREECKYAHDICTITCRFWEEGECFKGDTCPFLHGYYSGESVRSSTDGGCSCSSNSSHTKRTEGSPSIAATIHTSSVTHPSAPPEEFDKECRSLTQSKAQLSGDRISPGKTDPQCGSIPALGATDVPNQGSAAETPTITNTGCSGLDTLPNTTADPGCNNNRRGSGGQGVSSTAQVPSISPPPPSAS